MPGGRPSRRTGPWTRTTIDLPDDLLDRVDDEAAARDVSRNQIFVWTIERGLGSLVPLDSPFTREEATDG